MTSRTFPEVDVRELEDCVAPKALQPDAEDVVQRILAHFPDQSVCERIILLDGGYAPLLAKLSGGVHVVGGGLQGVTSFCHSRPGSKTEVNSGGNPIDQNARDTSSILIGAEDLSKQSHAVAPPVEITVPQPSGPQSHAVAPPVEITVPQPSGPQSHAVAPPVEITVPQPSGPQSHAVAPYAVVLACISTQAKCVHHPRVMLRLQPNSRLDLVEWHVGGTLERYASNCVLHVVLEPGSCLRHTRIVCESEAGQHMGQVTVAQHAHSTYQLTDISTGGAWRRTQVTVDLLEQGAQCHLHGLDVAWGKQAAAHDMTVRHNGPNCNSDQLCKGLYAGQSRGAFHGLVAVPPGGVETNARQLNRNLLLSPTAQVWTQPQLEIETDAVTCSHGATVSQLDHKTLFYFQSRGLAPQHAAGLLAAGFVAEVVDAIKPDWAKSFVRPHVDRALEKCLGDAPTTPETSSSDQKAQ